MRSTLPAKALAGALAGFLCIAGVAAAQPATPAITKTADQLERALARQSEQKSEKKKVTADTTVAPDAALDADIVIECVVVDGVEANHGATVSKYARETPPGPEHGRIVRAAAHSDCGKADDAGTDPAAPESDDTDDVDEGPDDATGSHGKSADAPGQKRKAERQANGKGPKG